MALLMSWVIVTAVIFLLVTTFNIRSLILSLFIGSRPVVGSSRKITFGFLYRALANATLFFIPPDSSEGYLSYIDLFRPTSFIRERTFLSKFVFLLIKSVKAIFSDIFKLSKSAPYWNNILNLSISTSDLPSYKIEPLSNPNNL